MFWFLDDVVAIGRDLAVAQTNPNSEPTGISLLDDVLQAESLAEKALDAARRRRDEIVAAARTEAQDIERRTDRRIETVRRRFTEATADLVREANDAARHAPALVDVDEDAARDAATMLAMRLVGIGQ